jgi:formylglycine-generating enzyme required for sulfatase activity
MDYEVRDRAHELLPEADLLLKADLYMLLASLGDLQGIEFARTNILKDNTALKQACLEILSFSRNPADGEFLRQHKRSFFKTVNLMQAFLKAQAVIDTVALSGEEKLDAMEKDFMNNEPLLAWLALYAARQEGGEALSWLRDFAGRHALFDYPEFVYATKLRGISAREILEKSGEAADSRPESSGPAPEAPGKPVPQEAALFFRTPLQGMEVFLDGKKIDVSPGELVEGLVPGRHKLRVTAPHGESISGKIPLEAGTVLPIETTLLDSGKETVNSIGIRLKFIPAGEFVMGSAELGLKEHRVAITTPLLVGIHEITNAQFEHFDPERAKTRDRRSREDNQPVILVSWYQAVKFCNWLSRQENLIPCYDENYFYIDYRKVTGYRLLTEAEWEYVARAGSKTRYPWGDRSKGERVYFANFYPKEGQDADGFGFTAPVATYIANEFGLFDVIGNVSEWCHDWYGEDYYERFGMNRPVRDPFGPGDGSMKVARGGSWRSREAIQVAYREFAHPADRSNSRGFRICRPVKSFSVRLLEPVELDKFSEIPVRKEL